MSALTGNLYQMAQGDYRLPTVRPRVVKENENQDQTATPESPVSAGIQSQKPAQSQDSSQRIESVLDAIRRWRGEGYNFTQNEALAIQALALGPDPDTAVHKFIAASSLSAMSGIDTATVYANLDSISQWYTGEDYQPNDATLSQKVFAAKELVDIPKVQAEWQKAVMNGDTETASKLEDDIISRLDKVGDIQSGLPHGLVDKIVTAAIENSGYIVDVTSTAGAASMATTIALTGLVALSAMNPITAGIAMAAIPTFATAVGAGASFIETASLAEASTFWDLMHTEDGIQDPIAANFLATVNGIITGATEAFMDGITARGVTKVAGKYADQIGISMLVDYFGTKTGSRWARSLMDWTAGWVDEAMLNEFPQQISDYLANSAYRHAIGLPSDFDFSDMLDEATTAAINGALVGMVYGGLGIPMAMRDYNSLSLKLRREANSTLSREAFFNKTDNLKPESMSESAYKEAQSRIWDASVMQRDEFMSRNYSGTVLESMEIAENELFVSTDEEGNVIRPDGSAYRTSQGRLYYQEDANPVETTVYFGDPETGIPYGSISFSDREDSVKINNVRVSKGYESLRAEMLTQVFADYGINKTIEWNPTTKGLQAVKQSLIDNNPDKTGLNYKAYSAKASAQTLADNIQKNMPSLTRPEALVSAQLYLMADRGALSANNNGMIFGDAAADGVNLGGKRGATNVAKSLIYAAKDADVSTFAHEIFHATAAVRPTEKHELTEAVRNATNDERDREQLKRFIEDHKQIWGDKLDIEGVMKSFENITDAWTRTQEEDLARLYEAYRSSTQSQRDSLPQKIKDALRRLADYINRVYRELKDTVPLNEDIAKAFDRLTGVEKTSSKTVSSSDNVVRFQEEAYKRDEELKAIISNAEDKKDAVVDYLKEVGLKIQHEDIIVLSDNTVIIKDDPDYDYDKEALERLKTSVSEQLSLFDLDGADDEQRNRRTSRRRRNPSGKRAYTDNSTPLFPELRGTYPEAFSPGSGWSGREILPQTVEGQWDSFGYVRFLGTQIDSPADIAKLYSIYRNPKLEYFHIVLLKEGKIVRQIGMSSGLPSITLAIPYGVRNQEDLAKYFSDEDFDQIYLIHNHPSGDPSASQNDMAITARYVMAYTGKDVKHVILDHETYTLIDYNGCTHLNATMHALPEGMHKIESAKTFSDTLGSPSDVASAIKRLSDSGTHVFYLNIKNQILGFDSFDFTDFDSSINSLLQKLKDSFYSLGVIVTDNADDFATVKKTVTKDKKLPVLDIIWIGNNGGYESLKESVGFESYYWDRVRGVSPYDASYMKWDSNDNPDILFQNAYHGSPHVFDRFSTDYIGTGEGNQTFGWGLYFTNTQNIAEGYASKLVRRQLPESEQFIVSYDASRKVAQKDLDEIQALLDREPESIQEKIEWLADTRGNYSEEWLRETAKAFRRSFEEHVNSTYERTRSVYETNLSTVKNRLENLKKKYNEISQEIINDKGIKYLESLKDKTLFIGNRSLYTAIIPDGPYLPWLERVSPELKQMIIELAQNEDKTRLLRNAEGFDPDTGETIKSVELAGSYMANGKKIYEILENELGSPKEASLFLKRAGIVGIEYQAGTLSGVNDSTATNYVVFDADDIKIADHIRYQDEFDRTRYSGLFRRASDPAESIFNPSTPEEAVDSADYMSPPDYPDFYDVPEDGEYIDDLIDPAKWDSLVTPGELGIRREADYTKIPIEDQLGYTYEEAVAATLPDMRYVGTDSAKDAQFIEALDDPDTFYRYMYLLGESLNLNRLGKNGYRPTESARIQIDPYTDQNHREQIQAMANARVTDVDVREVAKAWNFGQEVDPARVEIARKKIKKNARIYRDFFADLTGNADMKPNTLIEGRLNIQSESNGNFRPIDELIKIAQEAGFSEVEAKLRNGTLKIDDIDTENLKKIKEQIKALRRQYDSVTKANEKLNSSIKDMKATLADNEKEKETIDKKINGVIKLLSENVSRSERLKISEEYVKLSEELRFLEHGYDEIWNLYYKPTDGRTLRGHKEMKRREQAADDAWRKEAREAYGLGDLNEIKARKTEIKNRLETIRLDYAVKVARSIGSQIGRLDTRLQEAKQALAASQNASDVDQARISQLTSRIDSLVEELRKEKDRVDQIKSAENLQVANLKRQVARLQKAQDNFDSQIEATVGRMEAQYEAMVRRAQNQRDEIIEKQRQRRALEEIRAEKASLAKEIMEPVNLATTDWETGGQAIMAIQSMIDPEFRRDWIYALDVNLRGEARKGTMTIPEAKNYFAHLDDEGRQAVIDALSPQVIARLTEERKPLNDWTVEELKEMANEVYMLRKLGRETLSAKNAFLQEQSKYIVKSMLETLRPIAGNNLKNFPGSQETLSQAKNPKTRISQMIYSSRRPQELAQLVDGGYGKKGPAYNLLIDEKRYHQNRALRKMDERFSTIDPLITKETAEKLAKTHRIDFGDGHIQTFTLDDLAYIWLSQYEEQNSAAVAFGTLVTQEEKGTGIPRGIDKDGRPLREYLTSSVIADDEVLMQVGWDRYAIALREAEMALHEEGLMDLVTAIEKDLNGQGSRLQKMMVSTFNQPIRLVEHYLPIRRKDLTGENLDLSADAILNYGNSSVMHNPEKGFTITRVNVPPRQQTPINTSLLSVWRDSVRSQEWLIESAAYIKKLHRIFRNKEFQNALQGAYSSGLYREITDYIDLIANPYKQPRKTNTEKTFRALRGNLAAAYLGWKASGIITQAITSPMPFLSDVSPARLIKAYMDIAQDYSILREIDEKSPMMKHRSMSFVVEELAQRVMDAGNNKAIENWYKFTQTGMKGLEWIDRVAVAGGWLAKYQEELQNGLSKGLDTETAESMAVKAADDLVLKVQPTGDKTEYASMFRTENEFAKAILQFTTSLNVIWNNITADLQGYLRNKEYGKVVGTLTGYALAGLLLGVALTGFDDDDDAVDKARKVGYFTITQFLDSVPWIGSMVNETLQHVITGERNFYGTSSMFPAANELLQTLDAFGTGDIGKGLEKLGRGIGLATGLPTSMLGQVKDAIMDADPWKLIGR